MQIYHHHVTSWGRKSLIFWHNMSVLEQCLHFDLVDLSWRPLLSLLGFPARLTYLMSLSNALRIQARCRYREKHFAWLLNPHVPYHERRCG